MLTVQHPNHCRKVESKKQDILTPPSTTQIPHLPAKHNHCGCFAAYSSGSLSSNIMNISVIIIL